ncbi:hypothetical protein EMIHUDRAFT_434637, partial [Emiliania huxleyi CCMP1516]
SLWVLGLATNVCSRTGGSRFGRRRRRGRHVLRLRLRRSERLALERHPGPAAAPLWRAHGPVSAAAAAESRDRIVGGGDAGGGRRSRPQRAGAVGLAHRRRRLWRRGGRARPRNLHVRVGAGGLGLGEPAEGGTRGRAGVGGGDARPPAGGAPRPARDCAREAARADRLARQGRGGRGRGEKRRQGRRRECQRAQPADERRGQALQEGSRRRRAPALCRRDVADRVAGLARHRRQAQRLCAHRRRQGPRRRGRRLFRRLFRRQAHARPPAACPGQLTGRCCPKEAAAATFAFGAVRWPCAADRSTRVVPLSL